MLAIASVEGEEFTLEAAARVAGVEARDLIEPVSRELEKRHRLIGARGFTRIDGRRLSVYRFRHILFQRYLYEGLDDVERPHLHEQLGLALEALHGAHADEIALKLARHFEAAGMHDRAARYLLVAGMRCLRAGGYPEAVAHIESSLARLLALPPSRKRDTRELETWMALGSARHLAADPGQFEAFTQARDLAERLGDERQYGWALLWLYVVLHYGGQHREGARLADACLPPEPPMSRVTATACAVLLVHRHGCRSAAAGAAGGAAAGGRDGRDPRPGARRRDEGSTGERRNRGLGEGESVVAAGAIARGAPSRRTSIPICCRVSRGCRNWT